MFFVLKELHTAEKTKLINQLRDAKNHIEQLEQDKVGEEVFTLLLIEGPTDSVVLEN